MRKIDIFLGVLFVMVVCLPSAMALEGENPAEAFTRLTNEFIVIIFAVAGFCIVAGVLCMIIGSASATMRVFGARLVLGTLTGIFILYAAPWALDIIKPS
jgi:hypothetical protein